MMERARESRDRTYNNQVGENRRDRGDKGKNEKGFREPSSTKDRGLKKKWR